MAEVDSADIQRNTVTDNNTHRAPIIYPGQSPSLGYSPPQHSSRLLSSTSQPLLPTPSAANLKIITTQTQPSEALCPAFSNQSSSESCSGPTDSTYLPPSLIFSVNGRQRSRLPPQLLRPFMDKFNKSARLSVQTSNFPNPSSSPRLFSIYAIMKPTLQGLFSWYSQISSRVCHSLSFELMDVTCQDKKTFIVSNDQPDSFRLLKQHMWDLFWAELSNRGDLNTFTIAIEPWMLAPSVVSVSQQHDQGWYPAGLFLFIQLTRFTS